MRRHVSVPESQGCPVDIQEEGRVMLPKTWHKMGGKRSGELKVLIGKQQRSNGGVHAGEEGHGQSGRRDQQDERHQLMACQETSCENVHNEI